MSEERPETEGDAPAESVFGNLPGTRPGSRSPRRDGGGRRRSEPKRPAEPDADAEARVEGGPRPGAPAGEAFDPVDEAPRPVAQPPAAGQAGQIGGVEDLAWAGVAVAAEAATLGVRLASRAFEAMRDAVERR